MRNTILLFFFLLSFNAVFANKITNYEYWFDYNFANRIQTEINEQSYDFILMDEINFTNIVQGIHTFNMRFKDSLNKWSVVQTSFFYKPALDSIFKIYNYPNNTLKTYEYWVDDNFDERKFVEINPNTSILNLDSNFSFEDLNLGIHKFVIRFKDNYDKWSVAQTSYFYKVDNGSEFQDVQYPSNKIYGYRWWFDNKPETMLTVSLENKEEIYSGIINLQCPKLDTIGLHTFNIQFMDSVGKWSVAVTDTFLYEAFVISKPILKSPANNAVVVGDIILKWNSIPYISNYYIQISDIIDFSNILLYDSLQNVTQYDVHFSDSKTYYWRVKAEYDDIFSDWSDVWSFIIEGDESYSQPIPLAAGWNLISSYIEPSNSSIPIVWADVKDNVVIVKNNAGATYIPAFDIDDIKNWKISEGYQVYASQVDTLVLAGLPIVPENSPITLNAGWNIISYLRNSELDCETAFASITDNGNLVIVKDNFGNTYIPAYDINSIGNLVPGQGYQIYVINPDELTYPGN